MEGPGSRIIFRKLQRHAGRAFQLQLDGKDIGLASLSRVAIYGKRIYLTLGGDSYSIFFGMFGRFSEGQITGKKKPGMVLASSAATLSFYGCSIKRIPTDSYLGFIDESRDLTSVEFDLENTANEAKKAASDDDLICDVLLDQSILPGSGNIIKNEALFRSSMHPARKMGYITLDELYGLFRQAREFSMKWVEASEKGEKISPLLTVYGKKHCMICGRPLMKEKMGLGNRQTYWCSICQK